MGTGRESILPRVTGALVPGDGSSLHPLFSFQGFDEDAQQEGTLLGQFTYDQDGEPIQTFYFQVWDSALPAEWYIQLPIRSADGFQALTPCQAPRAQVKNRHSPCLPTVRGREQGQLSKWDRRGTT